MKLKNFVQRKWYLLLFVAVPLFGATLKELFNHGLDLYHQGNFDEASTVFEKLAELYPNKAEIHINLGLIYNQKRNVKQAAHHFKKAVAIDPQRPKFHKLLADMLLELKDIDGAIHHFEQVATFWPNDIYSISKAAFLYSRTNRPEQAYELFTRVLEIDPNNINGHYNIAHVLSKMNRYQEAVSHYEFSAPKKDISRYGLAKAHLALGNLETAWPLFEYRFGKASHYTRLQHVKAHHLRGKHVLLALEWGIGDIFHFVRYAKLLKETGVASITVETRKCLLPILSLCPYIDTAVPEKTSVPHDVKIPLLSLPMIFDTKLETIPVDVPYLHVDPQLLEKWREKLSTNKKFKIGICWKSGNNELEELTYTRRSIPLQTFIPLLRMENVSVYSLQKLIGLDQLNDLPDDVMLHTFPEMDEHHGAFMDTAAIMKNLDLVISSDTSIAHLAGGLGVPTFLMLPYTAEWRWLIDRADSPWYPTMKLFRQQRTGEWDHVMEKVLYELQNLID